MLIIIISYLIIISILCTLLLCQLVHKNLLSNKTLLFSNIGLLIISIITYIMTIVVDRTNLLFFILSKLVIFTVLSPVIVMFLRDFIFGNPQC